MNIMSFFPLPFSFSSSVPSLPRRNASLQSIQCRLGCGSMGMLLLFLTGCVVSCLRAFAPSFSSPPRCWRCFTGGFPTPEDTWIQCLGDLGCYRMAIGFHLPISFSFPWKGFAPSYLGARASLSFFFFSVFLSLLSLHSNVLMD